MTLNYLFVRLKSSAYSSTSTFLSRLITAARHKNLKPPKCFPCLNRWMPIQPPCSLTKPENSDMPRPALPGQAQVSYTSNTHQELPLLSPSLSPNKLYGVSTTSTVISLLVLAKFHAVLKIKATTSLIFPY